MELLNYYFMVIDPLAVNRQGNDTGIQYRTGIYYTDEDQYSEAEVVYKAEEEKAGEKLAVELEPLQNFFTAEEYHQKFRLYMLLQYIHLQTAGSDWPSQHPASCVCSIGSQPGSSPQK